MSEERRLSLEEAICLLGVDYRFSKNDDKRFIIKPIRGIRGKRENEINLLHEIGFKEDGEFWYIPIEVLEEYLNNKYQKILKYFDRILKGKDIKDVKIEMEPPYFNITGSKIDEIYEIFKECNLEPIENHNKVIINVWSLPF